VRKLTAEESVDAHEDRENVNSQENGHDVERIMFLRDLVPRQSLQADRRAAYDLRAS
jgi:hypothetical protein